MLEKGKILSEFAAVVGYHRMHAIRLLNPRTEVGVKTVIEGARIYGAAVKEALVLIWETADRSCGKRLKAAIPQLMSAMERHGHLQLDAEVRKQVLLVSAATMDRMLTPERKGAGIRRKRRLPKKLHKEIPIKTFADWKDPMPGFLEIDFVVHGGGSMAGEYLHSLVARLPPYADLVRRRATLGQARPLPVWHVPSNWRCSFWGHLSFHHPRRTERSQLKLQLTIADSGSGDLDTI